MFTLDCGIPPELSETRILHAAPSGDGAINRFRWRGDADAMDEVGGHNCVMKYQFGLLAGILKVGHSKNPTFDKSFPGEEFLPECVFSKDQV